MLFKSLYFTLANIFYAQSSILEFTHCLEKTNISLSATCLQLIVISRFTFLDRTSYSCPVLIREITVQQCFCNSLLDSSDIQMV